MAGNFERMMQLAEDVFHARNDPNQLDVEQSVLEQLKALHPATVSEYTDGDGPVAWVLLIPTTTDIMKKFLNREIGEKELFEQTLPNSGFDAVYLCSALVLEEYRRKGITQNLSLKGIEAIRQDHPVKALFVWAFSEEGEKAAEQVAKKCQLPLYKRHDQLH